jgi:methionyl-tRNA synthetase
MRQITQHFKCDKCEKGIATRVIKENRKGCEITMKKCDNCKYQYGLKEVNNLTMIAEAGNE